MQKDKEYCVICGRETEYSADTPISERNCYIEGSGQLCRECFSNIYAKPKPDIDFIES